MYHQKKEMDGLNVQLLKAVENNDLETVNDLIGKGANVNATTQQGVTPLMIAAARIIKGPRDVDKSTKSFLKIATLLLRYGAKTEQEDILGRTALMYIGLNHEFLFNNEDRSHRSNVGRGVMTELLLRFGADPGKSDKRGISVIDYLEQDVAERKLDRPKEKPHKGIRLVKEALKKEIKKHRPK